MGRTTIWDCFDCKVERLDAVWISSSISDLSFYIPCQYSTVNVAFSSNPELVANQSRGAQKRTNIHIYNHEDNLECSGNCMSLIKDDLRHISIHWVRWDSRVIHFELVRLQSLWFDGFHYSPRICEIYCKKTKVKVALYFSSISFFFQQLLCMHGYWRDASL